MSIDDDRFSGGDALLTTEDVCAWFNVKPSWVYDEVEAGRLPCVRLGRMLRFEPDELRRYLHAKREQGSSAA